LAFASVVAGIICSLYQAYYMTQNSEDYGLGDMDYSESQYGSDFSQSYDSSDF
jgi:hypothetical protein